VSSDEKKEKRAEKFGLITDARVEQLRKQRQERFKRRNSDISGGPSGDPEQKRAKRGERFGIVAEEDKIAKRKARFGDSKLDTDLESLTNRRRNSNGSKYRARGTFSRKKE